MRRAFALLLVASTTWAQEVPVEVQVALTSLRDGERAVLEKSVGPAEQLPLYRAELEYDPAARKVTGRVSITFTATRLTQELFLRVTPNANHPEAVRLSNATYNGAPIALAQPDPSLYRIHFEAPLATKTTATIELKLTAKVPEFPEGGEQMGADLESMTEGGGDYGAFSASAEVTCLSGVLPMIAPLHSDGEPFAGPTGMGDLGTFEPSNFVISTVVPATYGVLAPGNQVGEVPEKNRKVRFSYAVAAAREFPLLITKGYETLTQSVDGVEVSASAHVSEHVTNEAVLEHAVAAVRVLQQRLGPLPYRTLRVVEARLAQGAGGMEFPGLITVARSLYKGSVDPLAMLGLPKTHDTALIAGMMHAMLAPVIANTLEFTVDHEVAHQYFAMLVGNDPIESPVVDEALTQHAALLAMEWRRGKAAADEVRNGQVRMSYQMMRMLNVPDGKAHRRTDEFGSTLEYAGLVYGKAPLLFDAQRAVVGDDAWVHALKTYVEENRYQWVNAKSFTALVSKQNSGHAKRLEALRKRWWLEKHGDEDIGGVNLDALAGGQLGAGPKGGAAPAIDPKLLQQYEEAMKALTGE